MKRIALPAPALEVRDLRVVLAMAAAGSTARAAAALHLTQPAASRALLGAESRAGCRLFERTTRGLVPTAAGGVVLEEAPRVLSGLVDLERRLRTPPAPPARLRVVCECHTAYHWLPSALLGLRRALPELVVELAVEHTKAPMEGLRKGAVDVALLTHEPAEDGSLATEPLFEDEIVFVVAAGHPLAGKAALSRADLHRHRLLTTSPTRAEQRWFVDKAFGRSRPPPRVDQLPLTEAVVDMARAGLGVAILSEWVLAPHLHAGADLVVKRLARGALRRPWTLAYRREVAGPARRLGAAVAATAPRALAGAG